MRARRGSKMSACGKSHNAYAVFIYSPFLCSLAHYLDGALCIHDGTKFFIDHDLIVGQPVFQHKSGYAHFNKSFCDIGSFQSIGYLPVTSAGTNDHRGAGCFFFFRKENSECGLSYLRDAGIPVFIGL
jgi:hypothetical protein